MNTISIFRIIRTGVVNFWRNIWLSTASTLIMVVTLVILSVLAFAFAITSYSVTTIRERVNISVYLKQGLAETQISSIRNELESNPKIKEVTYITPEQALDIFRQRYQGNSLIADTLKQFDQNPLPATLQIQANNLEDYPAIAEQLKGEKFKAGVKSVNYEDNRLLIDRLNKLLKFVITFGIGIAAIFITIAILVIFNTITLTIYNRREEVEIMRLVGATNWYIRGPFIVESLMYSLVATIVTSALLIPVYVKLLPAANQYLNQQGGNIFTTQYMSFPYIVAFQLVIALLLSVVSSMLAIRRYLKI